MIGRPASLNPETANSPQTPCTGRGSVSGAMKRAASACLRVAYRADWEPAAASQNCVAGFPWGVLEVPSGLVGTIYT